MILFDLAAFPEGVDLTVWKQLYDEGLVIYDGKRGINPIVVDTDKLSLIDINEMSKEQELEIAVAVNKLNEDYIEKNKEERTLMQHNNQKLIKYLHAINNNEDPTKHL